MSFLPILLITVFYGIIYMTIHQNDPTAFGFENPILDPFYFSFTTMSTVGYGDFSPKTHTAKMAVISQQFLLITEIIQLLSPADLKNI